MKKTIIFILHIPFILLLWLCITSLFFIKNSLLNSSFGHIFKGVENISHSGPLATVLLLFVIPLLSLISCLYLAFKKNQSGRKYVIYILMSLFSLVCLSVFSVIMIIGLGNYL
ncbi:hypothetical protein D6118_04955 [Lactococcus lactis]|jgi:uncharacterized membrane protein YhaH (DUF805 family)|nr:hypothetical protein D6125_11725 [Lactococcus lactis]RQE34918.1 hypothetical protein D6122_13145 [Lactococcus lactis]RQE40762.1 hypothetical protein D6118_04955 [Lactococcus lactis]RQG78532.1 hypothetical protein D6123_13505 [Lactococcus lactis]